MVLSAAGRCCWMVPTATNTSKLLICRPGALQSIDRILRPLPNVPQLATASLRDVEDHAILRHVDPVEVVR